MYLDPFSRCLQRKCMDEMHRIQGEVSTEIHQQRSHTFNFNGKKIMLVLSTHPKPTTQHNKRHMPKKLLKYLAKEHNSMQMLTLAVTLGSPSYR